MFLVLLLAGAVLAVYSPVRDHEFVYDDVRFIEGNPALDTLDPVRFLVDPSTVDPTGGFEGIYRPLRTLSFAVQVAVFGRDPAGFLAVNALLHFLNALLVFGVIGRVVSDRVTPLLAAFFFAIHPVMVEGVAWATSHDNVLCGFFFLLAVRLYLGGGDGPWRMTAVGAAFSLALLAKETALMMPAVLAGYELTVGARGATLRASILDAARRRWRSAVLFFVVACVYAFLRYEVLGDASGQRNVWWEDSPLRTRLTAVVALVIGLVRIAVPVIPRAFTFDYRLGMVRSIADWRFLVSASVSLGLVALAILGRRRWPLTSLALAAYALLMLPTANLLIPINIFYADRFAYLAAIGPLAWIAAVLVRFVRGAPRFSLPVLAAFVVTSFAVAVTNVAAWRDDATLWARVLRADERNPRAHHAYAFALEGDAPEVVAERRRHLETALAIEPDYPPARRELGALLRSSGETALAIREFEELVARVEASPIRQGMLEYAYACRELVELHSERGRFDRALAFAERFEPFAPADPALKMRMGELAERLGDIGLARAYYAEALQIDSRLAPARAALERLSTP